MGIISLNNFIKGIWWSNDNKTYHNLGTGEVRNTKPEKTEPDVLDIISIKKSCSSLKVGYMTNSEDGNLVILTGFMKTNALKTGQKTRLFTDCNDVIVNQNKKVIKGYINSVYADLWIDPDSYPNAIRKTFGTCLGLLGGNNFVKMTDIYSLCTFLNYKDTMRRDGKTQRLIDELCKVTPEISIKDELEKTSNVERVPWRLYNKSVKCIVTVSKITEYKEPCCCIRSFIADLDSNDVLEGSRIYVTKNTSVVAKKSNSGEFLTASAQIPAYWNAPMLPLEKEVCVGTKLEYFNTIANEIPENLRMHMVFLCLKYPVVEQLYKSGFEGIVKLNLSTMNNYGSKYSDFVTFFDEYNPKEKNMFKAIDVNKYQLEKINSYCLEYLTKYTDDRYGQFGGVFRVVNYMHKVSKAINKPLASIDNITFDNIFSLILKTGDGIKSDNYYKYGPTYKKASIVASYLMAYGISSFNAKISALTDVFDGKYDVVEEREPLNRLNPFDTLLYYHPFTQSGLELLSDYLDMILALNITNDFKFNFNNGNELKSAHDLVTELYNIKKFEIDEKKFVEAVKDLEKYSYEGKKFTIVIPQKPIDLAHEGVELHHCVKSYISRVSNKSTGIVFIRQNEDLTKPFFTVEVQNSTIIQVHGLCNCNVEDPELMNFIKSWAKVKKLTLNPGSRGINIVR